jgi:hypothetical protein
MKLRGERYITALVDTIFEAAPKGDVDNVGMLPMLDMELVLLALVAVHACGLAHTDSLSGTPKALKRSVEDYAETLLRWTKEMREHAVANPFEDPSVKINMTPYAEGTPQ